MDGVFGAFSCEPLKSALPVQSVLCLIRTTGGWVERSAGETLSEEELLGMLTGYKKFLRDAVAQSWECPVD